MPEPKQLGGPLPPRVLATDWPGVGVWDGAGHLRVVAIVPLPAGAVLGALLGRIVDVPSRHSLQVGERTHLLPDDVAASDRVRARCWMYLDHSCDPNSAIRDRSVVALRDIEPGSAVTFDYNTTEAALADPFRCDCDAAGCVGSIRGAAALTTAQQAARRGRFAPHLRGIVGR